MLRIEQALCFWIHSQPLKAHTNGLYLLHCLSVQMNEASLVLEHIGLF